MATSRASSGFSLMNPSARRKARKNFSIVATRSSAKRRIVESRNTSRYASALAMRAAHKERPRIRTVPDRKIAEDNASAERAVCGDRAVLLLIHVALIGAGRHQREQKRPAPTLWGKASRVGRRATAEFRGTPPSL